METHILDGIIDEEIREKMPSRSQYLDVFSWRNSVKLDGTYSMDDLNVIVEVFKKHADTIKRLNEEYNSRFTH
jgi:hypothetical protein